MEAFREWFERLAAWEVFLYSLAAAFVLQWVLSRGVLRLARRTKTAVDDQIVMALRWPIFLTLLFLGTAYALRRIDPALEERVLRFSNSVLVTFGALIWMRAGMRIADVILDALARRVDDYQWIQPRSLPVYEILAKVFIVGGAIYAVFLAWRIDVTAWLASAGIIGIAVGFAAKDTLANLFAGIFILADTPYKLGDFIILESGERGRVTDIGIRSTRILTRDDIEITLPNAVIANSKIINETAGPHEKERVRVTVGVSYSSDIDKVREILMAVATDCDMVATEPAPRVRFREFGDSSLVFQLLAWIDKPVLRGRVLDRLNSDVFKRFREEGIEIPFPQRVITHVRE